jgi:hypothetical protein
MSSKYYYIIKDPCLYNFLKNNKSIITHSKLNTPLINLHSNFYTSTYCSDKIHVNYNKQTEIYLFFKQYKILFNKIVNSYNYNHCHIIFLKNINLLSKIL